LKEQNQNGYCLALLPRKVQKAKTKSVVPVEIQSMLEEFKEIVAEEMTTWLTPVHKISHQIDLILGSSLPNKAPHRVSPKKNEELNQQVQ